VHLLCTGYKNLSLTVHVMYAATR